MIPDPESCLRLLREQQLLSNVIDHCRMVQRVARSLCRSLNGAGGKLETRRVEAAALLHDIAKMKPGKNHSEAGAALLSDLGFGDVADLVRQHVILDEKDPAGDITEAELVNYADKRVKHTEIVSLEERFHDLQERYGKTPGARAFLKEMEFQSRRIEKRIFRHLDFPPDELRAWVMGNEEQSVTERAEN